MIRPKIDYTARTGTFHCSICNDPIVSVHESEVDRIGPEAIKELASKFSNHFIERHPDDLYFMFLEFGDNELNGEKA